MTDTIFHAPPRPTPPPTPPRGVWVWHLENYLRYTAAIGRSDKHIITLDGTWPQLQIEMSYRGIDIGPEPAVYGPHKRTVRKPPSEHHNPNIFCGLIEIQPSSQDQLPTNPTEEDGEPAR